MGKKKTPKPTTPKKPKESAADRQARAKANYKKLRDAGFSSADATRYRYSTNENITQVIQAKTLPKINKKKQGKSKNYLNIKSESKQYPYVRQRTLTLDSFSGEKYMNAVIKELKTAKVEGYTDFSIRITFIHPTGQETYASTPMDDISAITNRDDLDEAIAAAVEFYLERYKQGEEDPHIIIEIDLWDYAKKGKKAG